MSPSLTYHSLKSFLSGTKFSITHDSTTRLAEGTVTELPSHPTMYAHFPKPALQMYLAKFGLYMVAGLFDVPVDRSLNAKFPHIRTLTVRDVLSVWEGK